MFDIELKRQPLKISVKYSLSLLIFLGFHGGSVVKNPPGNAGDVGSVPGLGRYPGERNSYPLQCSCLGNSIERKTRCAIAHGVVKQWTKLSD